MAEDFEIRRQSEEPGFDAEGRVVMMHRIDFVVGPDGPFTIRIPASAFEASRALEMVRAKAADVRRLRQG